MHIRKSLPTVLIVMMFTVSVSHSAQWTFTPRASVQATFTDNLFLSNEDEQEDTITTVSAGFAAGVTGKKAGLTMAYDPSYAFYQEFTENDGWRHNASGNFFWNLTKRTRFEISDNFLLTEDPLSEDEIIALRREDELSDFDTTVRTGRQQYWRNTANARLTHQFGRDDSVYGAFTYFVLENEDPTIEDSRYWQPAAGLLYWFVPRWGFDINGYFTRSDFDQTNDFAGTPSQDFNRWSGNARLVHRFTRHFEGFVQYIFSDLYFEKDDPGVNDDYQLHEGNIGFDYQVEKDIAVNVYGGYFYRDNEISDDDTGFSGNVSLDKVFKRGSLQFFARTGWDQAYFRAENEGFNQYYGGGVNGDYQLLRRLTVDAYGGYRFQKYKDQEPEREDDIYRAGGGLTWAPLLWLSIRGGYSFREVQSNVGTEEYKENRGLITVNLAPDQPFRF